MSDPVADYLGGKLDKIEQKVDAATHHALKAYQAISEHVRDCVQHRRTQERRIIKLESRPEMPSGEDWEEITGVDDPRRLSQMARHYRDKTADEHAKAQRTRRIAAIAAPFLVTLGAAVWEAFKVYVFR